MTARKVCARCQRVIPADDAWGFAGDEFYCHPDDGALDDCYRLVTVGTPGDLSRWFRHRATIDSHVAGRPLEATQTPESYPEAQTPEIGPQ